jgi:hypothetical protein
MSKKVIYILLFIAINIFFLRCTAQRHPSQYELQKIKLKEQPAPTESIIKYDLETEIRIFLHEEYHPRDCFGMPGRQDERIVIAELTGSEKLVEIIKQRYKVHKRYDIYRILRSLNSIGLEKANGGYKFKFVDGNCCTITSYEGFLYLNNNEIIRSEITLKEVKEVPC